MQLLQMEGTWFDSLSFWQLFVFMYLNGIVVYLVLSHIMSKFMDTPGYQKRKQQDLRKSLLEMAGFQGLVFNMFFVYVVKYKPGKLYSDFSEYSPVVTLINFVGFFLLKDFGFYFIHRIMHKSDTLYKFTHYVHHKCRPSNAFSAVALDFWDVTPTTLIPLWVAYMIFPIHTTLFYALLTLDLIWSHFLHSSCGIYLGPYINSSWHHNAHHQLGKKNKFFGLYTCFWDILFDSEPTMRSS